MHTHVRMSAMRASLAELFSTKIDYLLFEEAVQDFSSAAAVLLCLASWTDASQVSDFGADALELFDAAGTTASAADLLVSTWKSLPHGRAILREARKLVDAASDAAKFQSKMDASVASVVTEFGRSSLSHDEAGAGLTCLEQMVALHAEGTGLSNKWAKLDIEKPCAAVVATWFKQDLFMIYLFPSYLCSCLLVCSYGVLVSC